MDLAFKASRMVSKPSREPARWIDALLLSADHTIARSSLREILAVQPLDLSFSASLCRAGQFHYRCQLWM